jgi:hypothetical protein
VSVQQIQLVNPDALSVTMNSLTLTETGAPAGQITSLSLINSNGTTLTTTGFSGTAATFNFTDIISGGGGTATYRIIANFSTTASTGNYSFSITGAAGTNGQPVLFNGLPVVGATVTIVTPTSTFTTTETATLTLTPTMTQSPTPTAPLVPIVNPPYPNPSSGNPVTIVISAPGSSTVTADIFSLAFRKIKTNSTYVSGPTFLTWDLTDRDGVLVANGLYYLRIQVTGPQPSTKIFKILVNR